VSPAHDAPVVIVGAGPVGLSLALGLGHHGVRSIVLERKRELDPHSRALGILPRTMEIFRAWDVLPPFVDAGRLLIRIGIWPVGRSEPRTTLDLGAAQGPLTATPGVLILPQDRTEALLLDLVRARGLADVRFGHEVTAVREDADGVAVAARDGEGHAHEIRGAFLAGCDGAHSRVRTELGWPLEGTTYPTRILLADVRLRDARDALPWPRLAPRRSGALAAIQFRPEHWRIICTLDSGHDPAIAESEPFVAGLVVELFGPGPFEAVWSSVFNIHRRTSPGFRRGRIVLAGDAAHINSPAGGQGMNAGIQDAHNLAWKLARVVGGDDAEALLAGYDQERRGAVQENVERYTDLLTRLVLLSGPLVRTLFVPAAAVAVRQPFLLRQIAPRAGMLDTRYRRSPLLGGGDRLVGARAPDGDLEDADGRRLRLHDLAARDAALLLFDDGRLPGWHPGAVADALRGIAGLRVVRVARAGSPVGPGDVRDAAGRVWKDWRATGETCALVRPDAHVGWLARRPTVQEIRRGVARALGARPSDETEP
jgi:2-polyprenyl-6-methoxyphenol hydroxylase-like FAD-dependent oxidoreductase